ncbi:kinase-like protein [Schizophyllum commune H4-8]|uniref:Aminoglycoside phosphotransferase domain-containing protein n=1 Tax=Schizophyllum commune (strain H4-8 / FGSC 9210) TaxID=578458 RepID=D8QBD4_SCHCM|nr:kinase-like protein [Schizophyllum commune H4-8]KAI5889131.1 kinase-like protein [Schizophyllum commune H4-8]
MTEPSPNPPSSAPLLPPRPIELNPMRTREPGCIGITADKKYFDLVGQDGVKRFLKRSLTEAEWVVRVSDKSIVHPSCDVAAHIRNEVAAIAFVRASTNVPVPNVVCSFDDGGRTYIIEDEVPGVQMVDLPEEVKPTVIAEVEAHMRTIHSIRATTMGGFCGVPCLPYRLAKALPEGSEKIVFKSDVPYELVLCHNDLSQHNVIVDPETLKINAILDWEFAGFYPVEFEGWFHKRPGPSDALSKYNEISDVPDLLKILEECRGDASQVISTKASPATAVETLPLSATSYPLQKHPPDRNPLRVMDPGCTYITFDKKYYRLVGQDGKKRFMKRGLTEAEWVISSFTGLPIPPAYDIASHLRNEAAAIAFVRAHTDIPVPNVVCSFDDGGRTYLIEDEVPGVAMKDLPDDAKVIVMQELEGHVRTLQSLHSTTMGGFCGSACLPYRLWAVLPRNFGKVTFKPDVPYDLVFCHNDLAQHNILVDPETLKITAILDWEFAGFYPKEFEGAFYRRSGPCMALKEYDEVSDVPKLLEIVETCASEESRGISMQADMEKAMRAV